jgi:uncharacterized protein (TIGR00251 family)
MVPVDLPVRVQESKDAVIVDVFVQPRAARDAVAGEYRGALKIKTTAPPVDDKANRAVEKLLADVLGLSKSAAEVVGGHKSRSKRVAIRGLDVAAVRQKLALVLSSPPREPL